MVQAMEGAMDGTSYGSESSRTNVQAMDQGADERASYGSGSS